jgi:hypothetical protein
MLLNMQWKLPSYTTSERCDLEWFTAWKDAGLRIVIIRARIKNFPMNQLFGTRLLTGLTVVQASIRFRALAAPAQILATKFTG